MPVVDPRRPSPRLTRPSPRLTGHCLYAVAGDRGVEDGVEAEAAETNVSNSHLPKGAPLSAASSGGALGAEEGWSVSSSSSSIPTEMEDVECQVLADLRSRLEKEAGLKDVPDDLLHCCCRVSGNNPARAYERALDLFAWREREGVDRILANPVALAAEREWRPLLHYGLPGRDRKSRPVMIQAVGRWDMKALKAAMRDRKNELLRSHVVLYEMLRKQAQEATPADAKVPADGSRKRRRRPARWVIVLDVEGLSIWHTRYPEVLTCLKEVSAMLSKNYPESIDKMFVVNASSGFHIVWSIISQFVKPNTRAKVKVLPEGDCRELVQECGAACIPEQFGGLLPMHILPYVSG